MESHSFIFAFVHPIYIFSFINIPCYHFLLYIGQNENLPFRIKNHSAYNKCHYFIELLRYTFFGKQYIACQNFFFPIFGYTKPANIAVYGFFQTPRVGLEPTTPRLTAACSTIELSRTIFPIYPQKPIQRLAHATPTPRILRPSLVKPSTDQLQSAPCIAALPPLPYLPRRLQGVLLLKGWEIPSWGGASRLDAFSAYPVRAWLPCRGIGMPTGPPVARPSRSSRTGDSAPQISCARAGQGPNCLTTF